MKLLTKSTLYFIVTSVVVFFISGVTVYYLLQNFIRTEIDDSLLDSKSEFNWELRKARGFDNFVLPKDSSISITRQTSASEKIAVLFGDTLIYDDFENELLPHRYIRFMATYNNDSRLVTIYHSLIQTDDIIEGLIISLLVIFIIMIVAISVLNAFGMRHVWQPFKRILLQIKAFDFRKKAGFEAISTDIAEFNDLNSELTKMTAKLTQDYFSLKEFSENASHEMQTPLAIIQSKLELLLQEQNMGEENLKAVNSAYQATNRLSRLHHELNLLTRIENQEYKDFQQIDLKVRLEKHIENFSDIIELKGIKLQADLETGYTVKANVYLLDILISNLFNNAIKHNFDKNGKIRVELKDSILTMSNSGTVPELEPDSLFERFKKGKSGSDSTGLGLALVKQICLFHDFRIGYAFQEGWHILKVEM